MHAVDRIGGILPYFHVEKKIIGGNAEHAERECHDIDIKLG